MKSLRTKRTVKYSTLLLFLFSISISAIAQKKFKPFENSCFRKIDGVSYHYRVWGPKDEIKGNVLFLHGFSGSTFSWRKNIDTLIIQKYLVVAVDLPPFGFSGNSEKTDYSVSAQTENIWELLDSISKGKWFIAGHSMGGTYAGAMAVLHPEKTAGVIFIDGTYFGISKTKFSQKLSGMLLSSLFIRSLADVGGSGFLYNYDRFEQMLASAYSCKPDSVAVRGYLLPFLRKAGIGGAVFCMASSIEKRDIRLFNNLPVLIIWGRKDAWIPLSAGIKLNKMYPGSELIIVEGAGHCPMETHPKIVNKVISDFLSKVKFN